MVVVWKFVKPSRKMVSSCRHLQLNLVATPSSSRCASRIGKIICGETTGIPSTLHPQHSSPQSPETLVLFFPACFDLSTHLPRYPTLSVSCRRLCIRRVSCFSFTETFHDLSFLSRLPPILESDVDFATIALVALVRAWRRPLYCTTQGLRGSGAGVTLCEVMGPFHSWGVRGIYLRSGSTLLTR
jgi:hypothetical protein